MAIPIEDELYAEMLGWEVLKYLKDNEERLQSLYQNLDSEALRILEKIQCVLDDDSLDDEDCFDRIEAIVEAFHENNISTNRHDWR